MSVSSPSAEQGRGTGWVVAQFALMAAIAGSWLLPPRPPGWLVAAGLCLAAASAGFAGWAFRTLGVGQARFAIGRG
jgi:protein-S-isoprenylcysteine O-methyltransferase Ste14